MPILFNVMQRVVPSANHGSLSVSHLPVVPQGDLNALRTQALQRGFQETEPGVFRHQDGGWATVVNGRIERGVESPTHGKIWFQGVPKPGAAPVQPAAPAAPPPPNPSGKPAAPPATNFGQPQPPQTFHGALMVAQIPLLNAGDLAGLRAAATRLGFVETAQDYYQHPDTSWIGVLSGGNGVFQRGFGGQMFRGLPRDLNALPTYGTSSVPSQIALGQVFDHVTANGFQPSVNFLLGKGFQQRMANYFDHTDGSWVAQIGSQTVMGYQGQKVVKASFMPPPPPPPPPGTYMTYQVQPHLHHQHNSADPWGWYRVNVALGKTPMMSNDAQSRATVQSLGYALAPSASAGTEKWVHPDGSWVQFTPTVTVGFQKWHIGQLPYNNRVANP